MDQKCHSAPCLGIAAILGCDEDQLSRAVIVSSEIVREAGIQCVTRVNDGLRFSKCSIPARRAGVNLGVEIQLGEQHVRRGCRRATVRVRALQRQLSQNPVQLADDEGVDLCTGRLRRWLRTQRTCFGHQWDVSKEIDAMPVAQGAKESSFRAVIVDLCPKRRIYLVTGIELRVRALAQEFVCKLDLIEDAIVHRVYHIIARAPGPSVQIGKTGVVPADHCFVRGHLLQIPIQTEVFAEAFVDASDVRVPVRPALSRDDQAAIDLGQKRPIRIRVVEHVG